MVLYVYAQDLSAILKRIAYKILPHRLIDTSLVYYILTYKIYMYVVAPNFYSPLIDSIESISIQNNIIITSVGRDPSRRRVRRLDHEGPGVRNYRREPIPGGPEIQGEGPEWAQEGRAGEELKILLFITLKIHY